MFNIVTKKDSFTFNLDVQGLDIDEKSYVKNLLDGLPGAFLQEMLEITLEIKTIKKQAVFLLGERICKAKELLKNTKNGTFSKWLQFVFGSRQTGYNILAYYEFYNALPSEDLKQKLKKMPQSGVYRVALEKAPLEEKIEIIEEHSNKSYRQLLSICKEKFRDLEKPQSTAITLVKKAICALRKESKEMSESELREIRTAIEALTNIMFSPELPSHGSA